MKSISTTNPAIMKNMECTIVKAHAPIIDIKVGVSLKHGASLHFKLFECLASIKIWQEAPLLALHLPKSHTETIMCIPQIVT